VTSLEQVEAVVKAVLYEGYMLYPYRPSSVKNRQRWTFGGVYPRDCAARDESLRSTMQTECLLRGDGDTVIEAHVRFLHLVKREVGELAEPVAELPTDCDPLFSSVTSLKIGEKRFHAWEEAVERKVAIPAARIGQLTRESLRTPFSFAGRRWFEPLRDARGRVAGVLARTSATVAGEMTLAASEVAPRVFRLTAGIENVTPIAPPACSNRDQTQLRAFASTHTIFRTRLGEFISLLDPPDTLADAAAQCNNQGTWPVMAGEEGAKDTVLSSPIILYDYPKVAPESPGDLFDATEIDEILTLRILAMTDEEKRDMSSVDERARALLERTEALTGEDLAKLHGTMREPCIGAAPVEESREEPWHAFDSKPRLAFLRAGDAVFKIGDRVRLRPKDGADIMDMVLADEVAVIEAIERDFEDRVHVAVVLENDPGREFGLDRMPGHRFFFSPEEIEAIAGGHKT
jgi:hypothetical protein